MKKLILSALLLSSPVALAGGYQAPVTGPVPAPRPAMSSHAATISIPALPLNATATPTPAQRAPSTVAVGEPTPGRPGPASMTPAQAQVFLLTAPSGTSVTLRQTVQMQMELEDVQVTGNAAKEMSEADIAEMREMFAEMSKAPAEPTELVMSVGKVFADGSRELVMSTTTQMPAESGMDDFTVRVIQRVEADGSISDTRFESDDAEMQAAFANMDGLDLSSMGMNDASVYGMQLTPGFSKTNTSEVDMQALMGGIMAGAVAAVAEDDKSQAIAAEIADGIKSSPLVSTTKVTYTGTDAQGRHLFRTDSAAQPWKMSMNLGEGEGAMNMQMEMTDMVSAQQATYRTDGLPVRMQDDMTMRMKSNVAMDDGTMSMTFRMKMNSLVEQVGQ
ncbi:hypothetical protein Deipr_1384 [Deinococcus proteolyticus MRP]|uniref:DUF4412 domain-containing protein n=1 Tax=Deinococcus proteolyticus (strain ATCC 35074 / DSM 20540 / JCM 6276 / NBRC 101906 / NCIMB 13154 / VKM Ac-1939 / CCM 2703 / MRP) TaxID=693977 RepID=F0RJ92_DEIPM|nr:MULTISPECIES: hypothetical protein [Deinococcus]ADY26529.1 hypothetical protein Deipr_1384 [Deinococcus proteolyticus MRP]MCY1702652.1 hypothetical protein [Deinococcus sp. SL84]